MEPNGRLFGSKSTKNGKYNPISVWFNKIWKRFLCVRNILPLLPRYVYSIVTFSFIIFTASINSDLFKPSSSHIARFLSRCIHVAVNFLSSKQFTFCKHISLVTHHLYTKVVFLSLWVNEANEAPIKRLIWVASTIFKQF